MHDLGIQLGRFIGGEIGRAELQSIFQRYVAEHPEERQSISAWLRGSFEEGRLSSAVWMSLRDLLNEAPSLPQPQPGSHEADTLVATGAHRSTSSIRSTDAPGAHQAPLVPGAVIKQRFVLVELLGSGGMGQVFKARDLLREEAQDRNPFVAVKVLNSEFSAHPASFMALQRESRRASSLAHPNVVIVHDFDRDGRRIFMTMEYLVGAPLDTFLRKEWSGGLALEKAWPVLRDIASALDYGHSKRIVHSDLKPGNIFICTDGTVKVLDFGISRLINTTDTTKVDETVFDAGQRIGGLTPAYASLEMWNQQAPDPRDDVYALACVTYELLSGRHPFGRASAQDVLLRNLTPARIAGLNRSQWESLRNGLAIKREERTASVSEFIEPFRPKTLLQRHGVLAAVSIGAAMIVALAFGASHFRDVVRGSALADMECANLPQPATPASRVELNATQRADVEGLLELAGDYLSDVSPSLSEEDLKSILSDGPNSVEYIIGKVLALDPGQSRALQLRTKVAATYEARAREAFAAGRTAAALDLVHYARAATPSSEALCRFELEVKTAQKPPAAQ